MAIGDLILTLGDLSVTLNRWNGPVRQRITQISNSRSASGTPIVSGYSHELPHVWQAETIADNSQFDGIMAIWARSEYNKRTTGASYIVTIDDLTKLYREVGPRTRALATGAPSETSQGTPAVVSYYAKFNAIFEVGEPSYANLKGGSDISTSLYKLRIDLIEADKVTP